MPPPSKEEEGAYIFLMKQVPVEHKYSGAKLLIHLNIRVALW